ncbi:MAG: hypothetical protein QOH50_4610 [Kribbellaceae bacterium]|jgi:hypothetical protein|nr:hypothetical protein [Kribbellaceae bacterium]
MKTLGVLLSTAGLVGAGLFALAPVAQAAPAASCSPAKIISRAPILRFHRPPAFGDILLMRDSCSRYWAVVVMDERLPPYARANAYLFEFGGSNDGDRYSCNSSGGTDMAVAGQRTCRTPKIESTDGRVTFAAKAVEFHNYGDGYRPISENQTSRTR